MDLDAVEKMDMDDLDAVAGTSPARVGGAATARAEDRKGGFAHDAVMKLDFSSHSQTGSMSQSSPSRLFSSASSSSSSTHYKTSSSVADVAVDTTAAAVAATAVAPTATAATTKPSLYAPLMSSSRPLPPVNSASLASISKPTHQGPTTTTTLSLKSYLIPTSNHQGGSNTSADAASSSSLSSSSRPFHGFTIPAATAPVQQSAAEVSALVQDFNLSSALRPLELDPATAGSWVYPAHASYMPRRDYQYIISRASLYHNTLVCLPTGLGKTLVASVVMLNMYRWYPQGKVVFLAPTRPLVLQQVQAFLDITGVSPDNVVALTGTAAATTKRAPEWAKKRVIFATPQTMVSDMTRGICPVRSIVCVVMDEAHRATGTWTNDCYFFLNISFV